MRLMKAHEKLNSNSTIPKLIIGILQNAYHQNTYFKNIPEYFAFDMLA